MKTTKDFLKEVKAKHGLKSDYALAQFLGVTRESASKFMSGKNFLGDETAKKVADILGYPPAYVAACMHAQRAKEKDIKKMWEQAAKILGGAAAAVVLTVALLPVASELQFNSPEIMRSAFNLSQTPNIHYTKLR